ncbi:recombinase RecX [Croceivirga radicis]|uniref:Regulatory protein RecX n=1 Tax=Croceivirga radicis TaxID=1929488 RepID=A0A1V6LWE4_9FLAO|nr:regulatory protein RecX [Croceivirga radicis]OQD44459.1 recombinase RecX [Croceivirga radicis]
MQNTPSFTVEEATRKLESYCAYQDRCHKEVVVKLKGMRMIPQAIDHIIAHLIQENYLNEERFAQSYARGKFKYKKWGRNRITTELKLRQISHYNIKTALKEIEADYHTVFHELADKKWEQTQGLPPQKRKKKLLDYLLYRGWESHLIYEKINDLAS